MGKAGLLAWCLVGAACGRLNFDTVGGSVGVGDANGSDGMLGDGPSASRCSGLAETCGPAGTSPCCASSPVPGGTFFRGYDLGPDGFMSDMTNPATVSDFRLDTYEVTVGRFRQFVDAGKGTGQNPPPMGAGGRTLDGVANQGGWDASWNEALAADTTALLAAVKCNAGYQTWTDAAAANESLPMNCVTWYEAMAFCIWDGGVLPTDAEWNYAAVGGSQHRGYPWSVPASSLELDCSYANYSYSGTYCVNPPVGDLNRVGSESPRGDGMWGHADLGGNVGEWTLDWYAAAYLNPCNDCADLTPATYRVYRGGSFNAIAQGLRGAGRQIGLLPSDHSYSSGIRCRRTP